MEQRLQKFERFFGKSLLRNLSRNRMLVFVNDTYSLNSKNKLTNTYLSETINFDEKGICDACRLAEKKDKEINWKKREEKSFL